MRLEPAHAGMLGAGMLLLAGAGRRARSQRQGFRLRSIQSSIAASDLHVDRRDVANGRNQGFTGRADPVIAYLS